MIICGVGGGYPGGLFRPPVRVGFLELFLAVRLPGGRYAEEVVLFCMLWDMHITSWQGMLLLLLLLMPLPRLFLLLMR